MRLLFLVLVAGGLLASPSHAGWGTSGCGPVGPVSYVSLYQWVRHDQSWFALILNGWQIGALHVRERAYFALLPSGQWQAAECPCDLPAGVCRCPGGCKCSPDDCHCDPDNCPCQKKKVKEDVPPDGVDKAKVEASKNQHIVNGRTASKEEVLDAIQKASVPADQTKLRLTVIGQKSQTDAILGDLKAIPEARDVVVSAYPPDHWSVKDSGLSAGRPFSIVLQSPSGRVLHRQWDYEGGISSLAEALRDAKADYDASGDPDRRKVDFLLSLTEKVKAVPTEGWLVVAALAFLLFRKKG